MVWRGGTPHNTRCMLYLYHGDIQQAKDKVRRTIHALTQKNPDALVVRVDAETFVHTSPVELLGSQGLFKSAYIIVVQGVLSEGNAETKRACYDAVPHFAESEHVVFMVEAALAAADIKKITPHTTKSVVCTPRAQQKEASTFFNVFALSDALMVRDKKKLWRTIVSAHQQGIPCEEMHGVLFWAVKNLLIAHSASTATAAGMKAYPFQKARAALKHFSYDELTNMAHTLAQMPQRARGQNIPLHIYVERFALTLAT